MAGGQQITSARGSVSYGLTLALVGLAITAGQGTVTPTGSNAAALSGQAITSAQGTIAQSADVTPSGLATVLRQGSMTPRGRSLVATFTGTTVPDAQIPLTGQASTSAQGTVTAGGVDSPALSGQESTSALGIAFPDYSRALTGSEITGSAGTITPQATVPFSGQASTSASGVMSASGFSVTAHLSGQEITSVQGDVDATPILTGLESTSATGTVVPSLDVALTGEGITSANGLMIVEQTAEDTFIASASGNTTIAVDVPLVGSAITTAQGTVTLNDGEQGLTGSVSTSDIGSVTVDVSCDLLGQEIASAQQSMGAPGFAALTGQSSTVEQGTLFTDTDRTTAITGSAMTAAAGSLVANPRQAMTSALVNSGIGTMGRSGGDMQQALTGLGVTSIAGSVDVVGQNPVQQTPSLEGCGITSGVAVESVTSQKTASSEGCFIVSNSANEVA